MFLFKFGYGTFWMFSIGIAGFTTHIVCAASCSDVCSHFEAADSLKESTFRKKLPRQLAPFCWLAVAGLQEDPAIFSEFWPLVFDIFLEG